MFDRSANGTVDYSLVVIVNSPARRPPPIWDGTRPPGLPRVGGGSAPIERERIKSRGGEDSGTVGRKRNRARQRPAAWLAALEAAAPQAPKSPEAEANISPQWLRIRGVHQRAHPKPSHLAPAAGHHTARTSGRHRASWAKKPRPPSNNVPPEPSNALAAAPPQESKSRVLATKGGRADRRTKRRPSPIKATA